MMTGYRSRGVAFAALLIACHGQAELSIPENAQYTPVQWPISWPNEDRLVILRDERWILQDAAFRKCAQSGVYETVNDSVVPLRIGWSKDVCREEVFREKVRGSADGLEAIFSSDGMIFRWQLKSSSLKPIRLRGARAMSPPAWSPDGLILAFVGIASETTQEVGADQGLYLMDPDGTGLRRIADFQGAKVTAGPVWAPDMRHLAVSLRSESDSNADSEGQIVIVDTIGGITAPIAAGHVQAWSPSGDWITYVAASTDSANTAAVGGEGFHLITSDGRRRQSIVLASLETDSRDSVRLMGVGVAPSGAMVWSPNGERLAVALSTKAGTFIGLVGIKDQTLRLLR